MVAQDDEVANLVVLVDLEPVVFVGIARIEGAVGKDGRQLRYPTLNEMDAGGSQGLQKPAGEPQRDTVLVPELLAATRSEPQEARLCQRAAIEVGQQRRCGLVVAEERARVHVAIADSMLQWNAPLPTGRACGRTRERRQFTAAGARHGYRAVARQPLGPVFITGLKRLFD